jgi:hypothetical protein
MLRAGRVGAALVALACNEDVSPPADILNPVCSGDYSGLPASGTSLEHDLMPIFGAACTFSSCHDRSAKKAGLVLGDPRSPTDPTLLKEVRDSLLAPSTTVKSPVVPRVTPFDPTTSFLLDKVTGTQNDRGYSECRNQDPSRGPADTCGDAMPLGNPDYCSKAPEKIIAIAQWIRDGALQN